MSPINLEQSSLMILVYITWYALASTSNCSTHTISYFLVSLNASRDIGTYYGVVDSSRLRSLAPCGSVDRPRDRNYRYSCRHSYRHQMGKICLLSSRIPTSTRVRIHVIFFRLKLANDVTQLTPSLCSPTSAVL